MFIVQVFNPAALPDFDGQTEAYEAWQNDPFMGIEILGFCQTEEEANALIDRHEGYGRRFHYEELSDEGAAAFREWCQ